MSKYNTRLWLNGAYTISLNRQHKKQKSDVLYFSDHLSSSKNKKLAELKQRWQDNQKLKEIMAKYATGVDAEGNCIGDVINPAIVDISAKSQDSTKVLQNIDLIEEEIIQEAIANGATIQELAGLVCSQQLSQKSRNPYGSKGLTPLGKRSVESAAVLLEYQYSKECLGFGTLTLPQFKADQMAWLSQDICTLVKRFFERLKRLMDRRNGISKFCYSIEMHPFRNKKYQQPIPHIHFVYVARKLGMINADGTYRYFIDKDEFKDIWSDIVWNSLRRFAIRYNKDYQKKPVENWGVRIETIRKSAAGYIGKYMSKSGKDLEYALSLLKKKNPERKIKFALPKQWWGVSKGLRDEYMSYVSKLPEYLKEDILSRKDGYEKGKIILLKITHAYYNEQLNCSIPVAYSGKIDRKLALKILVENKNQPEVYFDKYGLPRTNFFPPKKVK